MLRMIVVSVFVGFWVLSALMGCADEPGAKEPVMARQESPKKPASLVRREYPKTPDDIKWVDPLKREIPGVRHKTFLSKSMNRKVGFNIYLPPGYEKSKGRYPVIYWLHGIRGTESKYPVFSEKLQAAILAGTVPPMIMVFPNGGQYTFYCDSADGKIMAETMIIKELIPHVDANYRTIASRGGRAIEGYSMGGFGVVHLAFKYPDMFCSMAAGAPARLEIHTMSTDEGMNKRIFNSDPKLIEANAPCLLVKKNIDKIRGKMQVMLFVGTEDRFHEPGERFHKYLDELKIPHVWKPMKGFSHERVKMYDLMVDETFRFHAKAFAKRAARKERPAEETSVRKRTGFDPDKPINWVVKSKKPLPPRVRHKTFNSKALSKDVGYHIYLPPDYESGTERYPVIYWLHGIKGDECKGLSIAQKLHDVIVAGKVPPMILVLPNGGQFTFYCDSADGKRPSETVIIRELIPHVDSTYRTIALRKARGIEGSSMGAFGAVHLGLKYPDLFCSLVSGSTAIFDEKGFLARLPDIYKAIYNSDPDVYRIEDPYALARKNAKVLTRDVKIMLAVGTKDWAYEYGQKFHEHLEKLDIPHRYEVLEGVGHGRGGYYKGVGTENVFNFHAKNFGLTIPKTQPTLPDTKKTGK